MRAGPKWASLAVTVCLAAAVAAESSAQAHPAGAGPVVEPTQKIASRTLSGWLQAWWQWRLPLPVHSAAPLHCITLGQSGPVWFFATAPSRRPGAIHCTIPAGDYFVMPLIALDCSTVEAPPFHAGTPRGLKACVLHYWQGLHPRIRAWLDGRPLHPGFVVATGAFPFRIPLHDNLLGVSGKTHGLAAARGPVLLLRPLAAGRHTLRGSTSWPNGQRFAWSLQLTVA